MTRRFPFVFSDGRFDFRGIGSSLRELAGNVRREQNRFQGLLHVGPVFADLDVDLEGDIELDGGGHEAPHEGAEIVEL